MLSSTPALLLLVVLIAVIICVIKKSKNVTTTLTASEEIETENCIARLSSLKKSLETKKNELNNLRDNRKKECLGQVNLVQTELSRIQATIDNFGSHDNRGINVVPLPGGNKGPARDSLL
jgi:hypothetical protein